MLADRVRGSVWVAKVYDRSRSAYYHKTSHNGRLTGSWGVCRNTEER